MDPDAAGQALLGQTKSTVVPDLVEIPFAAKRTDLIQTINQLIKANRELRNEVRAAAGWDSYTPTVTNITVGNGTLTGRFKKNMGVIFFEVTLVFGTTTSFATVANYTQSPRVKLPAKGTINSWSGLSLTNYAGAVMPMAARMSYDASAASGTSSSTAPQWYDDEHFYDSALSSASTNLHDVGDKITWSGAYEAA